MRKRRQNKKETGQDTQLNTVKGTKRNTQQKADWKTTGGVRAGLRRAAPWIALAAVSAALGLCARASADFAEWYASHVYPILVGTVGRFCSIFPFSVAEMLLYILILGIVAGIVLAIVGKVRPVRLTAAAGKIAVLLFFTYTLGCGINYQREDFSSKAGFAIEESSVDEVEALCVFLAERLNALSEEIQVDEDGLFILGEDVAAQAVTAMQTAGELYADLSGYYPRAKQTAVWQILSYQQLEGVYSPFTIEANYNGDAPDVDQPASVCHELSHLKGFMREDEANFIACIACLASDSAAFNYSGAFTAYIYCSNALYADDASAALAVRELLDAQVLRDLAAHNDYWDAYEGTAAEVQEQVNDAYLKANAQEDGVKSYGRMTDLMLAWYRENVSGEGA